MHRSSGTGLAPGQVEEGVGAGLAAAAAATATAVDATSFIGAEDRE